MIIYKEMLYLNMRSFKHLKAFNEGFYAELEDGTLAEPGLEVDTATLQEYYDLYKQIEKLLYATGGEITEDIVNKSEQLILNKIPFLSWMRNNIGKKFECEYDSQNAEMKIFSY